jgi:hypothetical protein
VVVTVKFKTVELKSTWVKRAAAPQVGEIDDYGTFDTVDRVRDDH